MDAAIAADFQTLAQIAITLVGFTGIIGVIQARGGNALAGPEAGLIATLLVVSALAVFASFIPGTVALVIGNEADMWKWSFRVLIVAHIGAWIVATPFMLRAGLLLGKLPEPERSITRLFALIGMTTVVAEGFVVFGQAAPYSAFIYQFILITLVAIGFVSFVLLMFGLNR
jgi:hypothetical protein